MGGLGGVNVNPVGTPDADADTTARRDATGGCVFAWLATSAAGYLRLGLPAFAGGGAAALGDVQLETLGSVYARNIAGNADVCVARIDNSGGDRLVIGDYVAANRPISILVGATNNVQVYVGGASSWLATSTYLRIDVASVQFEAGVVAPSIFEQTDATAGVTGDDLSVAAQSVSDPAGGATAGDLGLRGGTGLVHAGNLDGNVWVHAAPAAWNSMEKGVFVADAVTAPGANPVAGGYLYAVAGAGTWRGSGGTVTAFGPAGPRCGACGHDHWLHASCSPRFGSHVLECGMCGKVYRKGPADIRALLEPHELAELVYDDDDPADPRPAHKRRSVEAQIVGPARRLRSARPTVQEYRSLCSAAIAAATGRAAAAAAIAELRAEWAAPWQSWRDHYAGGAGAAARLAELAADVAAADAAADAEIEEEAGRRWNP